MSNVMQLDFELRPLSPGDGAAFEQALRRVTTDNPTFFQGLKPGMGLYDYLEWLTARKAGTHLRANEVPSTLLFAFFGNDLIARYSLRHRLTDSLAAYAGHVGYGVLPPFRRMGVASKMLKHAAQSAQRNFGIESLIVTCDEGNAASQGVIEKCGGQFMDLYTGPLSTFPKRRYRISR